MRTQTTSKRPLARFEYSLYLQILSVLMPIKRYARFFLSLYVRIKRITSMQMPRRIVTCHVKYRFAIDVPKRDLARVIPRAERSND